MWFPNQATEFFFFFSCPVLYFDGLFFGIFFFFFASHCENMATLQKLNNSNKETTIKANKAYIHFVAGG
jgi:hypothetical protein